MAEGDTVYRWARKLESAFEGRRIEAVEAPNPRSPLRRSGTSRLAGLELGNIVTHGKHLILNFNGGLSLHAHMGMSGAWYTYPPGQRWRRPRKSAWLVMDLGGIEVVQFGGPTLRLVRRVELGRDSRLSSLGADLLDPHFDVAAAAATLEAARPMELGEALLDQHRLAGIGNIFKSESCFEARFDPWRPVDSFTRDELEHVIEIAARQLTHGAETGKRPQQIYRRSGKPCPRCRTRIRSRGQGIDSRTTYWCPTCQS